MGDVGVRRRVLDSKIVDRISCLEGNNLVSGGAITCNKLGAGASKVSYFR